MVKQVIVIRKDLGMRKGKMVAQGAHASMKVLLDLGERYTVDPSFDPCISIQMDKEIEEWICGVFTKIVVSVDSEEELLKIYNNAKDAGLHCSIIQDIGATEFHGVPTYTAVAVGPNKASKIDAITGGLKLL